MNKILLKDIGNLSDKPINWEEFRDTSILVTGATGLIGSLFIRMLYNVALKKHLNIRIYAQVRNIEKAEMIFAGMNLIYVPGDIKSDNSIFDKLENIDYIVHCAAITTSKEMIEKPVDNIYTSIMGTKNILELARRVNIRKCIFISSMEIYGVVEQNKKRCGEKTLGNIDISVPRSCYPEGKRMCECLCNAYFSQYGLNVCSARLAQTFGAGVSMNDTRVFAQFAKSVINGMDIELHTAGTSYGNYCYTEDVIYAILLLMLKGVPGEAYNVVNEETTMTIAEMAEMVADKIGNNKIRVRYPDEHHDMTAQYGYAKETGLRLSSEKIEQLGWKPSYGLQEMYERMIEGWK